MALGNLAGGLFIALVIRIAANRDDTCMEARTTMAFSDEARAKSVEARTRNEREREESKKQLAAMQEKLDKAAAEAAETRAMFNLLIQQMNSGGQVTTTLPKAEAKEEPEEEDYLVTVLHGYGSVSSTKVHWIDNTKFTGGVSKDVPWSIARHWVKGTRPDGGRINGRVRVHVLPNDATPLDYARAVGVSPMEPEKIAAVLDATNLDLLCQTLGPEKTVKLVDALASRIGGKRSYANN